MKKFSIADSVFKVNLKYAKLQNKSKELFFRCLQEDRSVEYFKAELEALWGINDMTYLEEQIFEYQAYLHEKNTNKKLDKTKTTIAGLAALAVIPKTNKLFTKVKEKEYILRIESLGYKTNKDEYLKKLVPKYTSDVKAYRNAQNEVVRFVKPSTYNSMVYNTTLTRNGWVQTLNDGDDMDIGYYYIPSHNFSCIHCAEHQNIAMSKEECMRLLGTADDGAEELLHPNCKCELTFYNPNLVLDSTINREQIEREYDIRQQVNVLTLRKEEILSDIRIQKELGNQDEVDRLNQQRNKINSSIKELQNELPTDELRKQVVAINR